VAEPWVLIYHTLEPFLQAEARSVPEFLFGETDVGTHARGASILVFLVNPLRFYLSGFQDGLTQGLNTRFGATADVDYGAVNSRRGSGGD
jgi:hypothetical protein